MTPMNQFIETHQPTFRTFFNKLIIPPTNQTPPQREEEEQLKEEERERWGEATPEWGKLSSLAKCLKENEKKIGEMVVGGGEGGGGGEGEGGGGGGGGGVSSLMGELKEALSVALE